MAFYLSEVLEQRGDSLDKGDDEHTHFAFPRRTYFWIVVSDERSSELQRISRLGSRQRDKSQYCLIPLGDKAF